MKILILICNDFRAFFRSHLHLMGYYARSGPLQLVVVLVYCYYHYCVCGGYQLKSQMRAQLVQLMSMS